MPDTTDLYKQWHPNQLFKPTTAETESFAAILLNQPVSPVYRRTIKELWERASLRLCADGGANRLFDEYGDDISLPHEIRGDLDSLRDDVKDYYLCKGVQITRAASQYATDLQKCIIRVEEEEEERRAADGKVGKGEMDIVILGGLSGRLDQTMHTLHVLCQIAETQNITEEGVREASERKTRNKGIDENDFVTLERRKRAWVLSENSLVWILSKASRCCEELQGRFGPTCGLIPFASQVHGGDDTGPRIWTKGLEWDLDGRRSAIGNFLSTSNHLKEDTIRVTTEAEIIFTLEVRED
ncbi:hypothetical protein CBS101457_004479 [Exobasidium rhododendri]|nr:hypothetical protein CBS101457_004479 [Exobasidium rhododendri]